MAKVSIERLGGLAGFGPDSKLRAIGEVTTEDLPVSVCQWVEHAVATQAEPFAPTGDMFSYRIVSTDADGSRAAVVAEEDVPQPLLQSIKTILT